jgi:hypothetical protein
MEVDVRQIKHPLSGAVYELDEQGNVMVTKDDQVGVYDAEGCWLEGAVHTVDPELCRWIGNGPRQPADLSTNRRFMKVGGQM